MGRSSFFNHLTGNNFVSHDINATDIEMLCSFMNISVSGSQIHTCIVTCHMVRLLLGLWLSIQRCLRNITMELKHAYPRVNGLYSCSSFSCLGIFRWEFIIVLQLPTVLTLCQLCSLTAIGCTTLPWCAVGLHGGVCKCTPTAVWWSCP